MILANARTADWSAARVKEISQEFVFLWRSQNGQTKLQGLSFQMRQDYAFPRPALV
jgi:hypothetical protein